MHQGQIVSLGISGDFFFYPAERLVALEEYLSGATPDELESTIETFYRLNEIESPGVTPRDLAIALGAPSQSE
jgi:hypothetical protein